jgi:hypothetical protein
MINSKKLLVLDLLVWFSIYLFVSMLSVYFATYLRSGSIAVAGITTGTFFLVRAVVDIISPRIFRNPKTLRSQIVIALSILLLGFLLLFAFQNIFMSFISVIVLAISLGMYTPAKLTLYSLSNKQFNERKWGNLDSVGLIAVSAAGFSSGLLVSFGGFTLLFITGIITSLITVIYSSFLFFG